MKFGFVSVAFVFVFIFALDLSAEPIRCKIDGFEFFFLQGSDQRESKESIRLLENFSDLFLSELKKESERLGLRVPQEVSILISADSGIFQKFSGQPRFTAGFYSYESRQIFFQNPNTLSQRGILNFVVKHEICHLLSPEKKKKDSRWLEEAYCESLYPGDPARRRMKSVFPKEWKDLERELNQTAFSSDRKEKKKAYEKMQAFGSWLLSEKGEVWFRNLLEFPNPEIETLYSKFLKYHDSK